MKCKKHHILHILNKAMHRLLLQLTLSLIHLMKDLFLFLALVLTIEQCIIEDMVSAS